METDRKRVHERTPTSCGKKRKRVTSTTVTRFLPIYVFRRRRCFLSALVAELALRSHPETSRKHEPKLRNRNSGQWKRSVGSMPRCAETFGNKSETRARGADPLHWPSKCIVGTLHPIRKQAETMPETRSMLQLPCTGQSKRTPALSASAS